ncbi:uncharacterized protein (DUF885 family) [Idiomarina aquatica]|uniref:Uncharacterized protein (DUF885 family) n=1 Tax=Idiomarina aquatica TaxID=1327752 RepID=A0A4R6NZ58_9GAMM|nr:DUF885 domain-containing protein [Idiomarina aquatica]TDP28361.1 uncharacterized protein (DUF885 family) [Idiomarina aquatica]
MKHSIVALALAGILAGCGQPADTQSQNQQAAAEQPVTQAEQSETQRLNAWFEEKYQQQLQQSPMQMTFLGRKDRYGEIDDMSIEAEQEQLAWLKGTVDELKSSFDYDKLSNEAKTSYDVWVYQYEQAKRNAEFRQYDYVFDQMRGAHTFMPQFLLNFHRVDTKADMDAYISRLGEGARALEQLLVRAEKQVEQGIRAPRFAYELIIEESEKVITGAPFMEGEDSAFMADANKKIDGLLAQELIDQQTAEALRTEAADVLYKRVMPVYEQIIGFFESDIENTPEVATGMHRFDGGIEFYNAMLKNYTTTDMTADEIHQLGLTEVERLNNEMLKIKDQVGFDGDLQEFFTFIRTDEQFFYPDTDEGAQMYIEDSKKYLAFINERLPDYFGILPKADLVVKRVESFREQDGAAQHYYPGTPDGSRPGIYYAHLSDMTAMPKNEMEAIAYHEGNPGHHMQISIAQELDSVPEFRTQAGFTVYSEGWGLYSEQLAKEMGAYQNPYSDFGRLITEIWRAVRLVVDTGMHAKGWTEEDAVKYFEEYTPIAEGAVRSEVRRYLVMPGQATAYKIGMIKILELREKAKQALGDKFDIRGFHDTVLGGGALPLHILERRVDQWIASQQA